MYDSRLHALRAQREMRQLQRRQREKGLFVLIVFGLVLAVILLEMGRAFRVMQQVDLFVNTISVKSPAQVKEELDKIAPALTDRNPLVRNAAATVFTVATGRRIEGGAVVWYQWWVENRATWRYTPPDAIEEPNVVSPHPYREAFPKKR